MARKPMTIASVVASLSSSIETITSRLIAAERRQIRRIGPAYRATAEQVASAYWREMQIGDQTVRLLVLDDDAEHGNG